MSKLNAAAAGLGALFLALGVMAQGDMNTAPSGDSMQGGGQQQGSQYGQPSESTTQPSMMKHGKGSGTFRRGKAMEKAGKDLISEGQKLIDDGMTTDGQKLQVEGRKLQNQGMKLEKMGGGSEGTTQQPETP